MLLHEIFQVVDAAKEAELEKVLDKFYKDAYEMARGNCDDQQKGFYLLVFYKNFRYGFFNQCIQGIEQADCDVKSLIPKYLWDYCEKHREAKNATLPWNSYNTKQYLQTA